MEVIDKDGNVCPNAEIALNAAISIAESYKASSLPSIIAFGNANLQDCDPYHDLSHKTWKGRALLVVKAGKEATKATVKINAEGLDEASA